MKSQKDNHQNYYRTAMLALILSLTACNNPDNQSATASLAQANAKAMKDEVHYNYFDCYALDKIAKKQCLSQLSNKYINNQHKNDKEYVQAFQFESEKLGFKHFLNDLKLPCESINEGPIFDKDRKAYEVTCKPTQEYLMQFNYKTKLWNLIKEDNND